MPTTRSRGEPILPFENITLRRMNEPHNFANIGDGINRQLHSPVDAHNKVIVDYRGEGALRIQPPAPLA